MAEYIGGGVMAHISRVVRQMYYSPTRRRHYAKASQAALAEARAIVLRKYPYEDGFRYGLRDDEERLQRVIARLSRRILTAYRHPDETSND